jgi:isopentenyl diphosphate isomerase/L-lactate dehydrogenase-like FMN-dependent dehydrogenase
VNTDLELSEVITTSDFEVTASRRLEKGVFDIVAGGAGDEQTLRANPRAFDSVLLEPRYFRDVSNIDTRTSVLGREVSLPVILGPTGLHKLVHPDGELATARAASAAGTIYTASTFATYSLEEIAEAASGPKWFQLYMFQDQGINRDLIQRAANAGYEALVLTIDVPRVGARHRDTRNKYVLPADLSYSNLIETAVGGIGSSDEGFAMGRDRYLTTTTRSPVPDDLDWLRDVSGLPLIVKGVLHPADAEIAIQHGASAIVVSNHGGRQQDSTPTSLEALPRIVETAAERAEVLLDGGVRRGSDIVKAVSIGARAVLIGRPYLYALTFGEPGIRRLTDILKYELENCMAQCGIVNVSEMTDDVVDISRLTSG